MPEIKGDGLDMAQLMNMFASKNPPENTIKRIEALEQQMADALAKLANQPAPVTVSAPAPSVSSGPGLDADSLAKLNDLLQRVQSLETRAGQTDNKLKNHDDSLADHERRLKALESMDFGGSATVVSGEVDTASIMKQVNMVRQELVSFREVKHAQDLEALRVELRGYTDKECSNVNSMLN